MPRICFSSGVDRSDLALSNGGKDKREKPSYETVSIDELQNEKEKKSSDVTAVAGKTLYSLGIKRGLAISERERRAERRRRPVAVSHMQ